MISTTEHTVLEQVDALTGDMMGSILSRLDTHLRPLLASRTTAMPIEPLEARQATLNVNGIFGGQTRTGVGTPCVADRCTAVFDRRFLKEERIEDVRHEILDILQYLKHTRPDFEAELADLLVVHPVETRRNADVVEATARSIRDVLNKEPSYIASPGTYDQKHVVNIGHVEQCIAYGPRSCPSGASTR